MTQKNATSRATPRARKAAEPPAARLDRGELDETLGFRLRGAWNYMDQYFAKCFAGTGLTSQHYAMLIVIEKNPGCRISDLCRAISISPNNIVPALDLLLGRGLVYRDFSTHDRRIKRLGITDTGRRYLAELRKIHQPVTDHFLDKLGAQNMRKLVKLLCMIDER